MEYVLKTNALCKNYKNFKALNLSLIHISEPTRH